MQTQPARPVAGAVPTPLGPVRTPRISPIKWWAALGIAYTAVGLYCWVRWMTSGNFQPTPPGPDHLAGWKLAWLRFIEFGGCAALVVTVWHWGIKPWRRAGRITSDGILLIAFFLCIFQNPLMNLTQLTWTMNAHSFNFGSWLGYIPGNLNPRAHYYVEALLTESAYVWGLFLPAVLGCALVRWMERRHPGLGKLGLWSSVFAFWFMIDFLVEPTLFVFTEVWAYPGVIHKYSLFAGTKYQFPMYEPFFMAVFYSGVTALRWFTDDRGRTKVEQGVDQLRASDRAKTGLRIMACTGAAALIFFASYNGPWNLISPRDDAFPKDMPSYLLVNMCGGTTGVLCPGPGVPINGQGRVPTQVGR